jgi:DNA uptake protein ComE-like DNA-binding protein
VEDESQDSLQIDVDTASAEELDALPEVGPSTAESIIE